MFGQAYVRGDDALAAQKSGETGNLHEKMGEREMEGM